MLERQLIGMPAHTGVVSPTGLTNELYLDGPQIDGDKVAASATYSNKGKMFYASQNIAKANNTFQMNGSNLSVKQEELIE